MQAEWLEQLINLVSGGPEATFATKLLRGFLLLCSITAVVQLLTMWSTRWGDHHRLMKSFLLSLLVHLCLGLGWATVIESMPLVKASFEESSGSVPIRLTAFNEPAAESAPSAPSMRPSIPGRFDSPPDRTRVERPTTQSRDELPAPERQMAMAFEPTLAEPKLREVPPQEPRLEKLVSTTVAQPVVSEVRDDQPTTTARPEAGTAAATRVRPQRAASDALPEVASIPKRFVPAPSPDATALPGSITSEPRPAVPTLTDKPTKSTARRVPGAVTEEITVKSVLRGRVTESETGRPIANTMIRFDRAEGRPLVALTRDDGTYELALPDTPDNFAVTASQTGYLPDARNLRAADVAGKTSRLDFKLKPTTENTIALEDEPVVHHLGNNQFEGRANSQFQRESEGKAFTSTFVVSSAQLQTPSPSATVSFSAKGVQCPPNVWINNRLVTATNDITPADGSYGTLVFTFNKAWLRSGKNEITIGATICSGDLDDFEFVNVQFRLSKVR